MSYTRIWIHAVWTTKNHSPYLTDEKRKLVLSHIKENAKQKGIYIDQINGWTDHLHALISLGANQSLSEVMQLIKGESSHWINKNRIIPNRFSWQDDYYGVSVGQAERSMLRHYISNQEIHHRKTSFQEELTKFLQDYDLD